MAVKYVILFVTLLVGSLAIPVFEEDDLSIFYQESDSNSRIVGGVPATPGSHTHMVALTTGLISSSLFCGGSMISERSVITAAHCIASVYSRGSLTSSLRVIAGTYQWNRGGQSYDVSRNVTHPNYLSTVIKNDIGLLITNRLMAQSAQASPVLVAYDHVLAGVEVRVAGWGRMRVNGGGSLSNQLIELTSTTLNGENCVEEVARMAAQLNIRAPDVEPHIELCAYHSPAHGTCRGDSGSALVRVSDGAQVGVVSWGLPCARGAPDMFARISGFADWLQAAIV